MKIDCKKQMFYIVFILLIISIPLIIVSTTVNLYTRSMGLYTSGFSKYYTSDVTGISNTQLESVAQSMINYFDGKVVSPQVEVDIKGVVKPVYSQKELIHLEDVRRILDVFKVINILAVIVFLAACLYIFPNFGIRRILKSLQIGAVIGVAAMGIIIIWSLVDFDSIFYLFHIVSFSNNLWILDPTRDYLIMMFPEGFFFDAAILIIGTIIVAAIVIWIAAFILSKVLQTDRKAA